MIKDKVLVVKWFYLTVLCECIMLVHASIINVAYLIIDILLDRNIRLNGKFYQYYMKLTIMPSDGRCPEELPSGSRVSTGNGQNRISIKLTINIC